MQEKEPMNDAKTHFTQSCEDEKDSSQCGGEEADTDEAISSLDSIAREEQSRIVELEGKVNELKDLYTRSQAEIQNIQRRGADEVKKSRDFAITSFAQDVILVKDCLEMALNDKSGNFETLKMGVELTLKQLIQAFEKQKIKEVLPAANTKLDPHLHQAMNAVQKDDQESNTIVEVMQKGYTLNDRVLRPAMVTVVQ